MSFCHGPMGVARTGRHLSEKQAGESVPTLAALITRKRLVCEPQTFHDAGLTCAPPSLLRFFLCGFGLNFFPKMEERARFHPPACL